MSLESGVERPRDVIPRWRSAASTRRLGEFQSRVVENSDAPKTMDRELEELHGEWAQLPLVGFAADLLSAAVVAGDDAAARDAAAQLLAASGIAGTVREMARRFLEETTSAGELEAVRTLPSPSSGDPRHLGRTARRRLRDDPRDVLAYTDLALGYASLGQNRQAERAMVTALMLEPLNRFVVRSASRFFVHLEEPDRAINLLRGNSRTVHDPWLLAAEIAISHAAGRRSNLIRRASLLADNPDWSDRSLSELRAALGTLELEAGNSRRARRLLADGLEDPTENTVAQVRWAKSKGANVEMAPALEQPRAYEARAVDAIHGGDWTRCIENSMLWLRDQPFSSRPAILGSYAAAIGHADYKLSAELAYEGLGPNPDDPALLNNLAVAEARNGNMEAATRALQQARSHTSDPAPLAALQATQGLIAFRSDQAELGRLLYRDAIDRLRAWHLHPAVARALLFWAEEERTIGDLDRLRALHAEATDVARRDSSPSVETLLHRLDPDRDENRSSSRSEL